MIHWLKFRRKFFNSNVVLKIVLLLMYLREGFSKFEMYKDEVVICKRFDAMYSLEKIPVLDESGTDYHFEIGCKDIGVCEQVICYRQLRE